MTAHARLLGLHDSTHVDGCAVLELHDGGESDHAYLRHDHDYLNAELR
jgi:hypothetical protein